MEPAAFPFDERPAQVGGARGMNRTFFDDLETGGVEEHEYGFVAALLTQFPEIASVRTSTEDSSIAITFLLSENPGPAAVEEFGRRLNRSLAALSRLIGDGIKRTAEARAAGGRAADGGVPVTALQIVIPLHSAVAEEFAVVRGMVLDSFGEQVIVEPEGERAGAAGDGPVPGEEEPAYPLEYSLRCFQAAGTKGHVYGFREGARVVVYRA